MSGHAQGPAVGDPIQIRHFREQRALAVIALSIVTFGVYLAFWSDRQARTIARLLPENPVSPGLFTFLFRSWYLQWKINRIRRRTPMGFCPQCGYNLSGLPEPRCPECGTPFDPDRHGILLARAPEWRTD